MTFFIYSFFHFNLLLVYKSIFMLIVNIFINFIHASFHTNATKIDANS